MSATKNLKTLIENSQHSIAEVARSANIDRTTIYRWVAQNRVPKLEYRQKLATALNVPVGDVPGGEALDSKLALAVFESLEEVSTETWIDLLDSAEHINIFSAGTARALLDASPEVLNTLRYRASRDRLKIRLVLAGVENKYSQARLDGFQERAEGALREWQSVLTDADTEIRTHNFPMGAASFDFGQRIIVTNRFNASPVARITASLVGQGHPSWSAAKAQFEFAYAESQKLQRS